MIALRPHQLTAKAALLPIIRQHRVAYLRGEVRTGKTLTALAVALELQVTTVLVVTKKKAIPSIEGDAEAIGMSGITTVTNYEALHKVPDQSWGLIVFDEAHGLGAYPKPSNRTAACRALKASYKLLMSGTPTPESYSQMYHQWWALGRGPWPHVNFYAWAKDYVRIQQVRVGGGQLVNDYSDADATRIMRDIDPYSVNMMQEEAGITTTIEERTHTIKMSARTVRLMQRIMRDGVIGGAPRSRTVEAGTAAAEMSKLRQLASGTVKWTRMLPGPDGILAPVDGHTIVDRSKARYVIDHILPTGKTAILYAFVAEGVMLRAMMPRWTDGPEVFNSDESTTYIGQVQASREGVNLSTADNIVFFGIDYSALSYLQGRDRATYVGRTKPPVLHWLVADGGIEQRVKDVVTSKESYTVEHYRHDKKKSGKRVGHTVGDRPIANAGGVDGDPPPVQQHARVAGPTGDPWWQGDLFGGQEAGGVPHADPAHAPRGAAASRDHCSRGAERAGGRGGMYVPMPPPVPDAPTRLATGAKCAYCYGRGHDAFWRTQGRHVALPPGVRPTRSVPCPWCGES